MFLSDVKVKDSEEVLKNWDEIKRKEKSDAAGTALHPEGAGKVQKGFGIPLSLPALQRAQKIGDKTKTLKFDWNNANEVWLKVEEEFLEFKEALAKKMIRPHMERRVRRFLFCVGPTGWASQNGSRNRGPRRQS